MIVKFHLSGIEELVATLRALAVTARRRALYPILKDAAEPMRVRMGQLAPREPGAPDIADNIVISTAPRIGSVLGGRWKPADENEAAVAVGPAQGFYYGIFQEYGTVHHGAQPFGRPAFDSMAPVSFEMIRRGLWTLMAKTARERNQRREQIQPRSFT